MLATDIDRGRAVAKLLHEAFHTTGIHGRNDMPEDSRPVGVERGSLEHILFLTLTVSIDYQRDANTLWRRFGRCRSRTSAALHAANRSAQTCSYL
jgi:hypothetical protein